MFSLHRNSQKRIYLDNAIYFVTIRTNNGYPYFREEIFCEIFIQNLKLCKKLKRFELYAFNLLYEHAHLLLKPSNKHNISKIMKSLKENVSCDINRVLGVNVSGTPAFRLREIEKKKRIDYSEYRKKYLRKHGKGSLAFPPFRWLWSFHDHIIRNDKDFQNHYNYTAYNHQKHDLPENWKYTSLRHPEIFDDI